MESTEQLLGKRGKRYGDFRDNAELAQQLKAICRDSPHSRWESLSNTEKEALDFILSKLARELSKSAAPGNYQDTLNDIGGFAELWNREKFRLHPKVTGVD